MKYWSQLFSSLWFITITYSVSQIRVSNCYSREIFFFYTNQPRVASNSIGIGFSAFRSWLSDSRPLLLRFSRISFSSKMKRIGIRDWKRYWKSARWIFFRARTLGNVLSILKCTVHFNEQIKYIAASSILINGWLMSTDTLTVWHHYTSAIISLHSQCCCRTVFANTSPRSHSELLTCHGFILPVYSFQE